MRTLRLFLSVLLLSACATPRSPPADPALAGTSPTISVDATDSAPGRGKRTALWTGIGFALYAIYEANNDDDEPLAPTAGGLCLDTAFSVRCW